MAFAVTSLKTYAVPCYEAVTAQFEQVVEITATRAATDVAVDIGNVAGTFWGEADNDATGLAALAYWKSVIGKAREVLSITSPQIEAAFARVVTGATGAQYQLAASTPTGIAYTLVSGQVLATFKVFVRFSLKSGELPVKAFGV